MKQVIVELDDATMERLEKVAPSRRRQRAEFIRAAVRRALDELAESQIAQAYRTTPDQEPPYLDPGVWEAARPQPRPARVRSRRKRAR